MTSFASDLDDFPDLLAATASSLNLPAFIIEKDYFVVRALRALTDEIGEQFLFKGGTSLSKGWNLLQRASEDIDLLFKTGTVAGGSISHGEVDRRLKKAEEIVANTPGFQFQAHTRSRGYSRCSKFAYPRSSAVEGSFSSTIQLEMGTRGGTEPFEQRTIRSYITGFAEAHGHAALATDLSPVKITCLDLTRTCIEKLFAAHAAFMKNRAQNRARHYYDLYQLLGEAKVQVFLQTEECRRVVEDVRRYSRENWPDADLPESGFSASPAFRPSGAELAELKRHYEMERDLFFAEPPTLDEILARLQAHTTAI